MSGGKDDFTEFKSEGTLSSGEKVPIEEVKQALMPRQADCTDGSDLQARWRSIADKYGGLIKPDIVFFGEKPPLRFFVRAMQDMPQCDLLLVMGTSLAVQPFAGLLAKAPESAPRMLINLEKVGISVGQRADSRLMMLKDVTIGM